MAAVFKLQFLIILIACFHSWSSYGSKLPCNGVEIVTYGTPCQSPRYLPVTIEEPAKPVTEFVLPEKPIVYRPLKLNYRVITSTKPILHQPRAEYPVSIEVPQVPPSKPLEIITPNYYRGKSYTYNIQTVAPPSVPISTSYDFNVQVPPSPSPIPEIPTPQSLKRLTGLTSRIDRILVPACQVSSSSCCENSL